MATTYPNIKVPTNTVNAFVNELKDCKYDHNVSFATDKIKQFLNSLYGDEQIEPMIEILRNVTKDQMIRMLNSILKTTEIKDTMYNFAAEEQRILFIICGIVGDIGSNRDTLYCWLISCPITKFLLKKTLSIISAF